MQSIKNYCTRYRHGVIDEEFDGTQAALRRHPGVIQCRLSASRVPHECRLGAIEFLVYDPDMVLIVRPWQSIAVSDTYLVQSRLKLAVGLEIGAQSAWYGSRGQIL